MDELNITVVEQLDRGLAYGEGCFETLRVIDGAVFRLDEHMARLQLGLAEFGICLSDEVVEGLFAQAMRVAGERGPDMLVRLTVTGGDATWGLLPAESIEPNVFIQIVPFSVRTVPAMQSVVWPFALKSMPAKFTADYADKLRAMRLWQSDGLNSEPLITFEEKIISGLTSNVLIYYEDRWHTPSIEHGGILPGIVRQKLLEEGVVRSERCPLSWLAGCEAIALCNSGQFILPVVSINGRQLRMSDELFAPLWQVLRSEPGVPKP